MAKTSAMQVRVNHEARERATKILENLGLSMGDAVNVFLKQVEIHNGLPFSVTLEPKSDILSARQEVELMEAGVVPRNSKSVSEFFAEVYANE
ncbi:MAG: type II toxin-antitoxin system RelB/DinJ family antitoxin [Firmicutes bacterium]|nr:type II toxin-antitoxin system RelB/DinJ family antitoxin [Bacillota bacterium]